MRYVNFLFFSANLAFVLAACDSASSTSVADFEEIPQNEDMIAFASSSSEITPLPELTSSSSLVVDVSSADQNQSESRLEEPSAFPSSSSSQVVPEIQSSSSEVYSVVEKKAPSISISNMLASASEMKNFDSEEIKGLDFDTEKKEMIVKNPVCQEKDGSLEWSIDGDKMTYSYTFDESTRRFSFKDTEKDVSLDFTFEGNFPNGIYIGETLVDGAFPTMVVENGAALEGGIFESDCLAKIFEDDDDMMEMLENVGCNEVSFLGITVKLESWNAEQYVMSYSYGNEKCEEVLLNRFAYVESDCKAAYEEYKNDPEAESSFLFDDYAIEESNPECFEKILTAVVNDLSKNVAGESSSYKNRPAFTNNVNKIKQTMKKSFFKRL